MPKGTKMERGLPVAKKAKTSAAVVRDSPFDALLDAAAQSCAEQRIKQARPTTIVFTGGPGVGKSTLAEHLVARLGDKAVLVPEAAMVAIDALNGMLGKSGQLGWRTAHSAAFGDLVGRIAMEQETRAFASSSPSSAADGDISSAGKAAPSVQFMIFDRTVLDGIAYSIQRGYPLPEYLSVDVVARVAARIDHVFILEPVALAADLQTRNKATGRKTDPVRSAALSGALHKVYERLGCRTSRLVPGSSEERAEAVLRQCGIACASQPASD